MTGNTLPMCIRQEPPVPYEPATASSDLQQETAEECWPFLLGQEHLEIQEDGLPPLSRRKHHLFLRGALGKLPAGFESLDASRPWMLYWCLEGISLLGEDVSTYQDSLVDTLTPLQNADGGFGGGHGQYSHLATSYASVLSLCMVGGDKALDFIDGKAMWHWLGSLKQPDGDFRMCCGGERDIRGAYCAMVIVTLLHLPTDLPPSSPARAYGHITLQSGLAQFITACQTYEGGIGSMPGAEAHGAYTFCALACLCLLEDAAEPDKTMREYLDMPALASWLSARQHAPEGGLAGRSNKVVDGCYSHWIGGCWALVETALVPPNFRVLRDSKPQLFNREALRKYILCCCQGQKGGLRDKPSKNVDAYHTCYNLAGLSATQREYSFGICSFGRYDWFYRQDTESDDVSVSPNHPIYVIGPAAVRDTNNHFIRRGGFLEQQID